MTENRCRTVWLALIAILAGGCGGSLVRADLHEQRWLLVETPHISLRTDIAADEANGRAMELERYWQALSRMYALVAPGVAQPAGRFAVIHVDSCDELRRLFKRRGFVLPEDRWLNQPTVVTCEGDPERDSLMLHELAHVFNHYHFADMPSWVNEGLATYYSTLKIGDGEVVIGAFPSKYASIARRPAWVPGLDAIRRMTPDRFYEEKSQERNYFAAWKLVHVLNSTGPDRQRRFRRYLAALRETATSEHAWAQSFGDLPFEPLADDYKWYQQRHSLRGWGRKFRWSAPTQPHVERLRTSEAHILWASLLAATGHPSEARAQLDRLAATDPEWPELLYWQAVLVRPPHRLKLLREYVARRPRDGRGWRALVSAELDAVPPDYIGLDRAPPLLLAKMESDVRHLIEHASDANSLNLVGWYFALRQNGKAGLNFAIRALQATPHCGPCWDTAGLLYFQVGRKAEALKAQERAVSLYSEGIPPDVLVRLRRFRAAVAAARK